MTARDELALKIQAAAPSSLDWIYTHEAEQIADAILAAGYRRPRTIAAVEELDALTFGATVLDADERVWINDGDTLDEWASLAEKNYEGGPIWRGSADMNLPATVLWEPQP